MTPEQQAAYVIAMSACAMIEAMGLQSGKSDEMKALIEQYGIHHNGVIGLFTGR